MPDGGASFRRATTADIPAMSRIRLAVSENTLSDPARVTQAMYENYLERDGRGWVAEVDGAIAAFSYADDTKGLIWALFVDPPHEGHGLAKRLLDLAVHWLFAQGHASVVLDTGAGTRAERFYALQGWRRESAEGREVRFVLARPA